MRIVRFNYLGGKELDLPSCLNNSGRSLLTISGCLIAIPCSLESINYSL